ncbi:UNVERIFIED_CONTAM: hypothetical protein FKN15_054971 [Acipenser sinensis]
MPPQPGDSCIGSPGGHLLLTSGDLLGLEETALKLPGFQLLPEEPAAFSLLQEELVATPAPPAPAALLEELAAPPPSDAACVPPPGVAACLPSPLDGPLPLFPSEGPLPPSPGVAERSALPGVAASPSWKQGILWPEPQKRELLAMKKGGGR